MNEANQHLQNLSMDYKRRRYPSVPVESIPKTNYKDNTANGLTKCIIDFLKFKGWQSERINNTGKMIDNRKSYVDSIGRSRTIGSVNWIKGNGTDGTADISATIAGKSVKIEVKIGSDRQSEVQKHYQQMIEKAGGVYYIATDFLGFYRWYFNEFKQLN